MHNLPPECITPILQRLDPHSLASVMRAARFLFEAGLPILYADPFHLAPCAARSTLFPLLLESANISANQFLVAGFSCRCNRPSCPAGSAAVISSTKDNFVAMAIQNQEQHQAEEQERTQQAPQCSIATATTTRYLDALSSFDGTLWMGYAVNAFPSEYRKMAPKFFLHIMHTVIAHSCARLKKLVLLPGTVGSILHLAPKMVSLKVLQFSGGYDRMELARVIQFLKANKNHGIKEVKLPKLVTEQMDSAHQLNHNQHTHQYHYQHHHHYHHHHHHQQQQVEPPPVPPHQQVQQQNHTSHSHAHNHSFQTAGAPSNQQQQLQQQQKRAIVGVSFYRTQQLQLILSLGQLEVMDANACRDFSSIAHRIPCQYLKNLTTFKYLRGFLEGDGNMFLRRCRALTELDFASFDRDVFEWAVEEAQQLQQRLQPGQCWTNHNDIGFQQRPRKLESEEIEEEEEEEEEEVQESDESTTTNSTTLRHLETPPTTTITIMDHYPKLVQLSILKMAVSEYVMGKILNSIAIGFSHSLENLLFMCYDSRQLLSALCPQTMARIQSNAMTNPDLHFTIDRDGFHCPKLKKFRVIRGSAAIHIGDGAFEGCPLLENLQLGGTVSCIGGAKDLGIWQIPNVIHLEVGDGASHRFRMETLGNCPLLNSLNLRDCIPGYLRSYETEPMTTNWTWQLKHLTSMQLAGRPAFQFRFEWIEQTPNLEILVVDGVHYAALVPSKKADTIKTQESGPICGAKLTSCNFQIHTWNDIDRNDLATLLETYCPKVQTLRMLGKLSCNSEWRSVEMGTALFATRNLKHLKTLKLHGAAYCGRIANQAPRFGLIRGVLQAGTTVWPCSELLKDVQIEALDGGPGCNTYRQKKDCVFRD
ncbi:hypothetical protein BG004_008169 [Podila humilis]|nr:hypothetical protein BG004_008169 [Podila humilis]